MTSRDPLRVAIDVGSLVGRPTGVGRFTACLVDALDALAEPPQLVRYVLSGRAELPPGVRRLPYPARAALVAWGRIGRPRPRWALRGVDVVHGTNFVAPPGPWATVITVHDCSPLTHPERVSPVVRSFVPVLRRAVAAGAWVHTPSDYLIAQAAELLGTRRVRTVPHGAPVAVAPTGPPAGLAPALAALDGRPYVLAVGTIEPRKNLVRLVDAFGRLAPSRHDLHLVLAGPPGADQPAVDAAVDRLPSAVRPRVVIAGWVEDPVREWLLARASVFAYPSLDEGFGLPVLEAFAAGVPTVAARAGSLPEVAGDAALLADPLDVDALAGALADAFDDPEIRQRLVRAGRARLGHFDWSATAAAMAELYRDASADRPSRRSSR
jgi:glycosyltransferase involved in cell wall biosynthesis